jgi:hypothetical protein
MASQEEVAIAAACVVIIGAARQKKKGCGFVHTFKQGTGKMNTE